MNKIRNQILNWQAQGLIERKNISKALETTGANNSPNQWFHFISHSLIWLSVLSIASGVIFFFAYNWDNITATTKFVMLQVLILISLLAYTQTKRYSNTNTAILFFIAVLLGSLFALFGQTYQTGKDPWQLFMLWTIFVTPIAFTSRSSSLWTFWMALAFLTLNLILGVRYGLFGGIFGNERQMLLYAFLGLVATGIFEFLFYCPYKLINNRIAAQIALVVTMVAFTWVAIYSIFEFNNQKGIDALFYLGWMTGIYYFYRLKNLDVLVLSSWVVSGIIGVISLLAKTINHDFEGGTFLLFGLVIIGLSTLGGKWLLGLLSEEKASTHGEKK